MDIKPGNIFISKEQKISPSGDDSADDGFEEEHEEEDGVTYKIGKQKFPFVYLKIESAILKYLIC